MNLFVFGLWFSEVMKGLWAKKQAKGKRSNQFEPLTAERLQRETAAAASRRSEAASELDKDNNQVIKTLFNTIMSLQFCICLVNLTTNP